MVLVVARPQCVVASAGVGIVVGCARDRTSKEMVSPDRSEGSDSVANAITVSAVYAYNNVFDVVVAAAIAAAAAAAAAAATATVSVVLVTATAAVTIAAVTTANATVNAAVTATASPATANTAVFDATSMIAPAANQASSAIRQTV